MKKFICKVTCDDLSSQVNRIEFSLVWRRTQNDDYRSSCAEKRSDQSIPMLKSEQTLKIFLLKWKPKKFDQFSSNKFNVDIGTSWNFVIKHIVDLNKIHSANFAFSTMSRSGRNAHRKTSFTIVEWWDFFVWKMKFSLLIASPSSRFDCLLSFLVHLSKKNSIETDRIWQSEEVKKCRSSSFPTVDAEICHQTVEMTFKGNFARMSTMKKLRRRSMKFSAFSPMIHCRKTTKGRVAIRPFLAQNIFKSNYIVMIRLIWTTNPEGSFALNLLPGFGPLYSPSGFWKKIFFTI